MTRRVGSAGTGRPRSQRQLRVGEEMRHALVRVVQSEPFRDPDLAAQSITVTEVRTSADLRYATVFVMPLGGTDGPRVVAALTRAGAFVRGRVAAEVQLRHVPELRFVLDESFDAAAQIDTLLDDPRVASDLEDAETGDEGG